MARSSMAWVCLRFVSGGRGRERIRMGAEGEIRVAKNVFGVDSLHAAAEPIRVELGSGDSFVLLEGGKDTNFTFEVTGCTDGLMEEVNSIGGDRKVSDRVARLESSCELSFRAVRSGVFARNLRLIDSALPGIMGWALVGHYAGRGSNCRWIADALEADDPFGFGAGMYGFKIKRFLCAAALGMTPTEAWSGHEDASRRYAIVREDGEELVFHAYNRGSFEDCLLEVTRLDVPSTERCGYGFVYKSEGRYCIDLNLQIVCR